MNNEMQDLKFTTAGDFMNMSDEGPFKAAFDSDTDDVIRREIITYRMLDGIMVKEEASRDYYMSGDYHDTINSKPLVQR
jgi:hypothetical protein